MSCIFSPLPKVYVGDTWDGLAGSLSSTGTAFSSPLALVRMNFKAACSDTIALTLSSESDQITIDDADAWAFTVLPKTPIGIAAGHYSWAIETTDDQDRKKTYMTGTIEVTADPG
jgi:hypothetical protein